MNHHRLVRVIGPAALACFALACEAPPDGRVELETTASELNEAAAWGFAFAHNATSSSYAPSTNTARSSSGGTIRANRLGTGSYRVDFPGLGGTGGWAIAVAVGLDNRRCTVDSYGNSSGTEQVFVKCHNHNGSAGDSKFNVFYQRRTATISTFGVFGTYLRAEANGSIVSGTSWNSRGGTNTVTRMSPGYYVVRLGAVGEGVHHTLIASAFNTTAHCKVAGWFEGPFDLEAEVYCMDSAGQFVDRKFTLASARWLSPVGTPSAGYAWFDDSESMSYQPDPTRRAIVINGTKVTATDADVVAGNFTGISGIPGHQFVAFNRAARNPPLVLDRVGFSGFAMATGWVGTYCKLEGESEVIARVSTFCFDENGVNVPATHTTVYPTSQTQ